MRLFPAHPRRHHRSLHAASASTTTVTILLGNPKEPCSSRPNQEVATPAFRRSRSRPRAQPTSLLPNGSPGNPSAEAVSHAKSPVAGSMMLQTSGAFVDDIAMSDKTSQAPSSMAPEMSNEDTIVSVSQLWHRASRKRRTKAVATAIGVVLAFTAGGIYCLLSWDTEYGIFILVLGPYAGLAYLLESLGYRRHVGPPRQRQPCNRTTESLI